MTSVANTFQHIRTPLYLGVYRTDTDCFWHNSWGSGCVAMGKVVYRGTIRYIENIWRIMTKILISGYYGLNYIGDESILQAVVHSLREQLSDIEITVLSQSPASTSENYGVASVDRKSLWASIVGRENTYLLISGGGSLLQDVTSKRSILILPGHYVDGQDFSKGLFYI